MNNYICTWFCEDQKENESYFPQTGKSSASPEHQLIYWRCIVTFYITSVKFNPNAKHLFFTNANKIPVVDGADLKSVFQQLGVEIITTDFKYKTPIGYYKSWQNQFYEFSILEYIATNFEITDLFLILDSDCLFIKSAEPIFEEAKREGGFLSYEISYPEAYNINGLNRLDMQSIYEEILNRGLSAPPAYHAGEFLLCSVQNIREISEDFKCLWPILLARHNNGQKKFNEEAHTLSFLYFKNNLFPGGANKFVKRIWTNPAIYRNVEESDDKLIIWHLPAEKGYRLHKLFYHFMFKQINWGLNLEATAFANLLKKTIAIPRISPTDFLKYYINTYSKALKKRIFDFKS